MGVLGFLILFLAVCPTLIPAKAAGLLSKKLGFSSAKSAFRIAVFADLHYGENAWTFGGPLQDQNSDGVMSTVLNMENPDFVIFLGDVVTANNLPMPNASKYWEQAISSTRNKKIPWASLFGNHDDMAFEWPEEWFGSLGVPSIQCSSSQSATGSRLMPDCYFRRTTRAELIQLDMQHNLSYSSYGPKSLWPSISNYVLQVTSSKHPNLPAAFLYFLDSGGGSYPEVISASQARWFQQTSAQKNPGARIPEIVFWHIPSQAYGKIASSPNSPINQPCVGSINLEAVAPQVAEWGIMDILTNRTSVKAVIVGHNHGLDWCCPYKSLWLCYARHTGYGGYGSWPKGARILELVEEPFAVYSWIRMENGITHSNITLASKV